MEIEGFWGCGREEGKEEDWERASGGFSVTTT